MKKSICFFILLLCMRTPLLSEFMEGESLESRVLHGLLYPIDNLTELSERQAQNDFMASVDENMKIKIIKEFLTDPASFCKNQNMFPMKPASVFNYMFREKRGVEWMQLRPYVLAALSNPDKNARYYAISALRTVGIAEDIDLLISLLDVGTSSVQDKIRLILFELSDVSTVSKLRYWIQLKEADLNEKSMGTMDRQELQENIENVEKLITNILARYPESTPELTDTQKDDLAASFHRFREQYPDLYKKVTWLEDRPFEERVVFALFPVGDNELSHAMSNFMREQGDNVLPVIKNILTDPEAVAKKTNAARSELPEIIPFVLLEKTLCSIATGIIFCISNPMELRQWVIPYLDHPEVRVRLCANLALIKVGKPEDVPGYIERLKKNRDNVLWSGYWRRIPEFGDATNIPDIEKLRDQRKEELSTKQMDDSKRKVEEIFLEELDQIIIKLKQKE